MENYKRNNNSIELHAKFYIEHLVEVLRRVSTLEISNFIDTIIAASERGSSIYFIGNGGSAATASHFVNDILIGTKSIKKPFRAISLCDNQAVITAIANDYGYEYVFSQQLSMLLNKNDVVVAISASGNSLNLLKAIDIAKQKEAITIGLTSFDGGKLKEIVDVTVHVPTEKGEYGPAEDVHMMLDHLITSYLMHYSQDLAE
ncbi:MAG TPA: SIS domain-containing protein [Candidatus Thioglobus autotrophicus]|jgi:D-sedoheptulose 7-phosphate isomerase|nr:SIS domain-containing protein [Candidatus Thioglobus autotrophicus]